MANFQVADDPIGTANAALLRDGRFAASWRQGLPLVESHLTRHLFGTMLRRVALLPVPAG